MHPTYLSDAMIGFLSLEWDRHSCKKVVITPEFTINKCDSTLATHKWFYINHL
jgi:hypothetical protein